MISTSVFANDSQRKVSTGELTSSQVIKASSGVIYDIEIVATTAAGYAVVFDSAVGNPIDGTTKKLAEVREATQYNSKHVNLGEFGVKAYKGISLYLENATAIITYY